MKADATAIAGTWFRHVPSGGDVFYEPPDPADNRWQRGSVVEALYFGESEATAWAEWYRQLAEAGMPPRHGLPRDLWRLEIALPRVADLRGETRLARLGLPRLHPHRFQWPAFQRVGEQLRQDGWPALVSTSAARPEGCTLCVFRTTREPPGVRPLPPPVSVQDAPVVPMGLRT